VSSYYDRYQRGERIQVWSDLIALGEAVRQEPVYSDAVAVARETMARARQNVETLITRLDGIGYEFLTRRRSLQMLTAHLQGLQEFAAMQLEAVRTNQFPGYESLEALQPGFIQNQFLPAAEQIANSPHMQNLIEHMRAGASAESPANSLEDRSIYARAGQPDVEFENVERTLGGPLPISLRAWSEAVSRVSFLGSHPILNPSTITADPLILNDVVGAVRNSGDPDLWDGDIFLIAPAYGMGASYGIRVPDRCADVVFGDSKKGFFVEYLRRAFAWSGFPGWERLPNPPMDLIRELTHGLRPI